MGFFQFNIFGTQGWETVVVKDEATFYTNMLQAVVTMAKTRQSPVPIVETLEILRVLDAARRSLETGRKVSI